MKKKIYIIILSLLLIAPIIPAQAVNDASFSEDTTIALTIDGTSENFTLLSGAKVDQLDVQTSSVDFTLSAGGVFTFRSAGRKGMAISPTVYEGTFNCGSSYSEYILTVLPSNFTSGTKITITPSAATCSGGSAAAGASTPSGGGGSSNSTTKKTTTTETATTETTTAKTTTTTKTVGEPAKDSVGNVTLQQMTSDAEVTASGDVNQVIAKMGIARDTVAEAKYNETLLPKILPTSGITAEVRNVVNNFVTYGTPATKVLGASERAGVVNSFRAAFGKVPSNTAEWNDVVKIANGRWPTERSTTAENRAKASFRAIYLRAPNMDAPNDNAAVTVMAYGLRPANRNLDSERAGIKIYTDIYGRTPVSATAWDAVRAIAYSGATR